jgi:hypothetical protein
MIERRIKARIRNKTTTTNKLMMMMMKEDERRARDYGGCAEVRVRGK